MRKKLFFGMIFIGVFVTMTLSFILCLFIYRDTYEENVVYNEALVDTVSSSVDQYLGQISNTVNTIVSAPQIKDALNERNSELSKMTEDERKDLFRDMNLRWFFAGNKESLSSQYTENESAEFLNSQLDAMPTFFGDILLTNKYGELVASTDNVVILNCRDKYWWQACWNNGKGDVFFDDVGYIAKGSRYVLGVVMPVYDNDEIIGVLRCNVNIMSFFEENHQTFENITFQGRLRIVRGDGTVVYGANTVPLSEKLSSDYDLSKREKKTFEVAGDNGKEVVSVTPIKRTQTVYLHEYRENSGVENNENQNIGQGWLTIYNIPRTYVFEQMLNQIWALAGVDVAILFVLLILGILLSNRLVRPIRELEARIQAVGEGDFDVKVATSSEDEIERLANAFNNMTDNLKKTVASKTELEKQIGARNKAEKENALLLTRLAEQQKLDAIGTLTSGLAHEINNPINGIMNYAQIIKEDLDSSSINHHFAEEICKETARVSKVISNLFQFSKADSGLYLTSHMENIVKNTLALVEPSIKKSKIQFFQEIEDNLPHVYCQRQQIQLVLLNIILNAINSLNEKFPKDHEDKKIFLTIQTVDKENQRWVQVRIKDNGIGISKSCIAHIFDPFFTSKTRAQASGLGLAVSYGIIKEHGGDIWVKTQEDVFTTFFFELPAKTF